MKKTVFVLCFFDILQYLTTLLSHREQDNLLIELSIDELRGLAFDWLSIGLVWRGSGLENHLPNALESR